MKNVMIVAALALFISIYCYSIEITPKFEGYLYDLPTLSASNDMIDLLPIDYDKDVILGNITRLRLRPELLFGDNGRLTMHYEISSNYSSLMTVPPNFDKTNRQALDLNWELASGDKYSVNHFIDRLYYKQMFDFGEVIIGRQNIAYGVGRIWQPTDKFNPINPANFTKFEKDGADAVRAKIYIGNFTDLDLVYNATDEWQTNNFAARFRTNWKEYDFSVMGGWFDDNYSLGGDFAGNLFGAGVRGEIAYTNNKYAADSSYFKAILGADNQFTDKLYGLIEYHYNGQGSNCKLCYLPLFAKLYSGEIQNIGTNYLAAQVAYQIHPLWNSALLDMTNLIDGSGFVSLSVSHSAKEWLDCSLAAMFCYGAEGTEYSYYSTATYLMIKAYF